MPARWPLASCGGVPANIGIDAVFQYLLLLGSLLHFKLIVCNKAPSPVYYGVFNQQGW